MECCHHPQSLCSHPSGSYPGPSSVPIHQFPTIPNRRIFTQFFLTPLCPSVACSLSLLSSLYIMDLFLNTLRKLWLLTSLKEKPDQAAFLAGCSVMGRISAWSLSGEDSAGSLLFLVLLKIFFNILNINPSVRNPWQDPPTWVDWWFHWLKILPMTNPRPAD